MLREENHRWRANGHGERKDVDCGLWMVVKEQPYPVVQALIYTRNEIQ